MRAVAQQAAAVLSDPNSPSTSQLDALNLLEGVVGGIALVVTRRFPEGIRQRIEAEAFSVYCEKRHKFDPARGQGDFVSWFARVLRNLAIDYDRRIRRGKDLQSEFGRLVRQDERIELRRSRGLEIARDSCSELVGRFDLISSNVAELEFTGILRGSVNYHSVFALSVRLAVVASLSRYSAEECRCRDLALKICEQSESLLVWADELKKAPLCRGWHSAETAWDSFKVQFSDGPDAGFYSVNVLCGAINSIPGDFVRLTPEKWYQWVKRAKERARPQIDPDTWRRYFAPLLPDHKSAGSKKS